MGKNFLLAFIPIFVAVDALGVLPIFVNITQGLSFRDRAKVIIQSFITALCLAVTFIFVGRAVFAFLGITVGDFMVAGGVILFSIAILDILNPIKERRVPALEMGVVPLGTPLIVGPAVLTTSLIVLNEYGTAVALCAVITNIVIAAIIFSCSRLFTFLLGEAGSRAISKIISLLLGAIAIMMIRKGFIYLLHVHNIKS